MPPPPAPCLRQPLGRLNQIGTVQDTQGWRNIGGKEGKHQLTFCQPRGGGGGIGPPPPQYDIGRSVNPIATVYVGRGEITNCPPPSGFSGFPPAL